MNLKYCTCLCFLVASWLHVSAQDESLQQLADSYAAEYLAYVSKHAVIFSGVEQQSLPYVTRNHSYFNKQTFQSGRLSYNGVIYPEVLLRWDLYKDELIIFSPVISSLILKKENVDYIEIYGYHIFPLDTDSLPGCPAAGYYSLLHSGNCMVIERKNATLQWNDEDGLRNYYFTFSSTFYLRKDGVYHKIKNKNSLLKHMATHRKDLNRLIRSYGLRFKTNAETIIVGVVKEYEKLMCQ